VPAYLARFQVLEHALAAIGAARRRKIILVRLNHRFAFTAITLLSRFAWWRIVDLVHRRPWWEIKVSVHHSLEQFKGSVHLE